VATNLLEAATTIVRVDREIAAETAGVSA